MSKAILIQVTYKNGDSYSCAVYAPGDSPLTEEELKSKINKIKDGDIEQIRIRVYARNTHLCSKVYSLEQLNEQLKNYINLANKGGDFKVEASDYYLIWEDY